PLHRAGDGTGLVQVVLVEVDVEVDAELVEGGLDLVEHQCHAARAEPLLGLVVGQVEHSGLGGDDGGGDIADVAAGVAVLGRSPASSGGEKAPGEPVDLSAVVVEVVLPGDVRTGRGEDPGQCITDGSPSRAAQMDRAGRVRRDELEVDPLACQQVRASVCGARLDDGAGQLACTRGVEGDVEESGAGDVDSLDALDLSQ